MSDRSRIANSWGRIRCVALDAVGTVIFAEPSVSAAYAEIGWRFGSKLTAAEIRDRLSQAMRRAEELSVSRFGESGRTDELTELAFWQQVVGDVLPDVTDRAGCFEELFEHFARPESWRCFHDVEPTVADLKRRGLRVVLASNFDARLNRVCDGLAELRDATDRVISSLIGYRKTNPGFYRELTRMAECDPDEILMVGDDFTNDVESAKSSGLHAAWLRRGNGVAIQRDAIGQESHPAAMQMTSLTELLEWLP